MAELENLEAKMANIEVSLSASKRTKKSINSSQISTISRCSLEKNGSVFGSQKSLQKNDTLLIKELNKLKHQLKDKENIIQSLKNQLNTLPNNRLDNLKLNSNKHRLTTNEKQQAEERLLSLKNEMELKRMTIKNLKLQLDRLDIRDDMNIDVKIEQAELEYKLGREELNALSLLEEARAIQQYLDQNSLLFNHLRNTLFSYIDNDEIKNSLSLLFAFETTYDIKSPKIGFKQIDNQLGIEIDWFLDNNLGLLKGDRIVEINGKIILNSKLSEIDRLLETNSEEKIQLVILRKINKSHSSLTLSHSAKEINNLKAELNILREHAEQQQSIKETLKNDNLRLTHRICYLEDQVNELLKQNNVDKSSIKNEYSNIIKTNENITNISITTSPSNNDLQIFQKGKVTAVLPNYSSDSTVDKNNMRALKYLKQNYTNIPVPDETYKNLNYKSRLYNKFNQQINNGLNKYSSQLLLRQDRKFFGKKSFINLDAKSADELEAQSDYSDKKRTIKSIKVKSVDELEAQSDYSELKRITKSLKVKSSDELEAQSDYSDLKQTNNKFLKIKSTSELEAHQEYSKRNNRIVKSIQEFDNGLSDYHSKYNSDYMSEPDKFSNFDRPKAPKKPMRLSIHKAQSLHSMHKGRQKINEIERPSELPPEPPVKLKNRHFEINYNNSCVQNAIDYMKKSSRPQSSQSALRWPLQKLNSGHLSDNGKWC